MLTLPKKSELFGTDDPAQIAAKFDAFCEAVKAAPNTGDGTAALQPTEGGGQVLTKTESRQSALANLIESADVAKALGADVLASVRDALDASRSQTADLVKDLTLTSPLSTGYVAYDLEAPAKLLTPKPTPLRNRIVRKKGQGTSRRYKRITGFTGTGTGGVGVVRPGLTDASSANFGSLTLNRGQKISYAGDELSIPYLQFGLSDSVPWSAQFAGEGFQDYRGTSRMAVLYASMLVEEREMLGGRGTASGFYGGGAFAAPTGITLTARAAGATETGLSGVTTNVYAFVTTESMFGESVLSAVASVAAVNGQVVDVKVGTDVAGANGYRVYVGTGAAQPANAAFFYAGRTGYQTYTLQGALPTSGAAASGVTVDTSASALDYDGILTICSSASSGYRNRINSALSTSNPGSEFQTAFASLYDAVKADPDHILFSGQDRRQQSDALKTSASSNYRLTIRQDELGGVILGDVVTAIQNEVTGKTVNMEVHPWMPQGNAVVMSDTLPIPDTEVSDVWAAINVQDYMAIDWPVIQQSYDVSSYWFGTFLCYAPAWNGIIQGIKFA